MYCVYITIYKGNKLPPFYIGYTTEKNISRGYAGSVSSKKYHSIWKKERKNNPYLFKVKTIKKFKNRLDAIHYENYLHRSLNVTHNALYINQAFGFGSQSDKAWNKGLPNEIAKKRMLTDNPMKNPEKVLQMRKTKLGRTLKAKWKCLQCNREEIRDNTVKKMKHKFCNKSCATTFSNKKRKGKKYKKLYHAS